MIDITDEILKNEEILKIHSIKVGRGDCIILQFYPDKSREEKSTGIMIDMRVTNEYTNFSQLIAYLENNKITLSRIVITHPHEDHYVGICQLILYLHSKDIKPNIYISPHRLGKKHASLSDDYVNFLELYHSNNRILSGHRIEEIRTFFTLNIVDFKQSYSINLSDDLTLGIYPPSKNLWEREELCSKYKRKTNNFSLFCDLLIKENRFIFCGDIETSSWRDFLEKGSDHIRNVRFFKFSHHGSKNGFPIILKDRIELLDPSDCLITNGKSEEYKKKPRFPDETTLSRIKSLKKDRNFNIKTHQMRELCEGGLDTNRFSIIFKYYLKDFHMERTIGSIIMPD